MKFSIQLQHRGVDHVFDVDMTAQELFLYQEAVKRMDDATWAHHKQEAVATKGLSLRPREHLVAAIIRTFYLQNDRFPTRSELLRRVAP
jgi:hypothetical protein